MGEVRIYREPPDTRDEGSDHSEATLEIIDHQSNPQRIHVSLSQDADGPIQFEATRMVSNRWRYGELLELSTTNGHSVQMDWPPGPMENLNERFKEELAKFLNSWQSRVEVDAPADLAAEYFDVKFNFNYTEIEQLRRGD